MKEENNNQEGQSLNLYQKIAKITGEIGAIAKDGKNQEQKYDFIEYAAVAGRLRQLFSKYGVVIVPRMQEAKRQQRVEITSKYGAKGTAALIDFYFEVVNADDPSERFTVRWTGEAADYGDKASNKAATGALKYYLMRQFNISEKGEDADEHTPDIADRAPVPVKKPAVGTAPKPDKDALASQIQKRQIKAFLQGLSVADNKMSEYLETEFGIIPGSEMTAVDATNIIRELRAIRYAPSEVAA